MDLNKYFQNYCSRLNLFKHICTTDVAETFNLTFENSITIFLAHIKYFIIDVFSLSEYSDENMMDPYNLAICYGPTLLPIPQDRDQVAFQSNVNDLVKNIIIHQEEIFPHDGGSVYEKCILEDSR